jgi:hypothetical protein
MVMPGLEELTRDLRSHSDEVVDNAIRSSEGVQGLAGMIVKEERDAMREAAMMQQAPQNPPTIREQMMGLPEIMPTMENVPMEAIQGIGDPNLMAMNQAMMNAPRNDQALAEGMRMGVDAVEEANRNAAMNAGIAPLPMEEEMFTAAEGGIVGFQDRGLVGESYPGMSRAELNRLTEEERRKLLEDMREQVLDNSPVDPSDGVAPEVAPEVERSTYLHGNNPLVTILKDAGEIVLPDFGPHRPTLIPEGARSLGEKRQQDRLRQQQRTATVTNQQQAAPFPFKFGQNTAANNQLLPENLPRDLHDFPDEGGKDILEEVANAGNEAYGTDFWSADTLRKLMLFGGLNFAQGKPIAQSLNEGLVTIMEDKAIRDKLGLEERKVDALMDLNRERINARKMDIKSRIGDRRYDMLSAKQDFFRSVLGEQYTKEEMYNAIINKHSQKELQEMGLYTDPFWGKAEKIPYSEAPEKIRQQIEKEYDELVKGVGREIEEVNKQQLSLLKGF